MGLSEFFADVVSSLGLAEAQAEAPAENGVDASSGESGSAADGEKESAEAGEEEEEAAEAGDDDDEEEEAEEEEPEDIKPKLEEECANSSMCAPFKHHFDECVERVTKQDESDHKGPKEDCIEEFFHLQHCATQCAAPKLWKALK